MNVNAKTQLIAGDVSTGVSDLVAWERGILLRSYMGDMATVEQYNQSRRATADHIGQRLSEFELLTDDPQMRQMIAEMRSDMEREEVLHTQLLQLAKPAISQLLRAS